VKNLIFPHKGKKKASQLKFQFKEKMASVVADLEREAGAGPSTDYAGIIANLFGPNVDGQQVLIALKNLSPSKWPQKKNGATYKLPDSYKKWVNLSSSQLVAVQSYWTGLKVDVQDEIVEAAKAAIVAANMAAHGQEKSENATKHDKVRLMHLYADPTAQMLWSRFLGVKTRPQLDADNSHPSDGPIVDDSGQKLAEMFNNRSPDALFQPQNRAIKYIDGLPKFPYEPANELVDVSVVRVLADLDPNQAVRPNRGADWIKAQWSKLNSNITQIWHDYCKSGQQFGDPSTKEGITNWVMKFAARFTEVEQYSILILEKWQLDSLGKRQPSEACRDSGLLDVDGNEDPASGSKRSSREDEPPGSANKRSRRGNRNPSDAGDLDHDEQSMMSFNASILTAERENIQFQALTFFAKECADTQDGRDALDKLRQMAGIGGVPRNPSTPKV